MPPRGGLPTGKEGASHLSFKNVSQLYFYTNVNWWFDLQIDLVRLVKVSPALIMNLLSVDSMSF